MLQPSRLIGALRRGFGEWSTATAAELKQIFGSKEAVDVLGVAWDVSDALGQAAEHIDARTRDGEAYMRAVQADRDANADSQMTKLEQRLAVVMEEAGARQLEVLKGAFDKFGHWIDLAEEKLGPNALGNVMLGGAATGALLEVGADAAMVGFGAYGARKWQQLWSANRQAAKDLKNLEREAGVPRQSLWQRVTGGARNLRQGGWRGALGGARDLGGKALRAAPGALKSRGGIAAVAGGVLGARGPLLPAGIEIRLPQLASPAPAITRLWD